MKNAVAMAVIATATIGLSLLTFLHGQNTTHPLTQGVNVDRRRGETENQAVSASNTAAAAASADAAAAAAAATAKETAADVQNVKDTLTKQAEKIDTLVRLVQKLQTTTDKDHEQQAAVHQTQKADHAALAAAHSSSQETNSVNRRLELPDFNEVGKVSPKAVSKLKLGSTPIINSVLVPENTTLPSLKLPLSTHICAGRTFQINAPGFASTQGATCNFQHLCVAPGRGTPPAYVAERGHYEWFYLYNDLPPNVNINFTLGVGPHQVDGKLEVGPTIITNEEFSALYPKVRVEQALSHIYYEYNAENFGHFVTDLLLPIYAAMAGFDKLDTKIQIIKYQLTHDIANSCDYQINPGWDNPNYRINKSAPWKFGENHDPEFSKHCELFYRKLTPMISSRRMMLMDELFKSTKTPVCFKNLLVGTPNLSDDCTEGDHGRDWLPSLCNSGRMEQFWNFRQYTKQNLGVVDQPPKHHQVVIWDRADGGRPLIGLDEIRDGVRTRFNVPVRMLEWSDYSIQDQLRIAGNTTVLITGPGAGSFAALYLPRGATQIRLYESEFGMEFHIFNYLGYIHSEYRQAPNGDVDKESVYKLVALALQRYEGITNNFQNARRSRRKPSRPRPRIRKRPQQN